MTEIKMAHETTNRPVTPRDASPDGHNRAIPPLVWVVLAILLGWFAIAAIQNGGLHRTPQGGTTPQAIEPAAHMPAAPANGSAPATPAGTVNGVNQPPAQ
jgi:hypothetical protein